MLSSGREEVFKLLILEEGAEGVSNLHDEVASFEGGASDPGGLLGNLRSCLGL